MSGVKDRLLRFIQEIGISTAEFERSIGVSGGYVSNISKSIQPDKLEIISRIYPSLNIEWLLINNGKMTKPHKVNSINITAQPYEKSVDGLAAQRIKEIIQYLNTSIETFSRKINISQDYLANAIEEKNGVKLVILQSILKTFDFINPEWLIFGDGSMLKSQVSSINNIGKGIPYYADLPVSAGQLDTFMQDAEPTGWVNLPGVNSKALFPVVGCSMKPEINPGDVVGIVQINSWEVVDPDKTYLIITHDERMIKHLAIDENDDSILWCISPNYPKFKINKSDIKFLYRISFCGKLM